MPTPLSFLAMSDIPECDQVYDRRVVGYGTIQITSGARLTIGYDDDWFEVDESASIWPAYPGPRLRFHASNPTERWHHRHLAFAGPRLLEWEEAGLWPFKPQPVLDSGWVQNFTQIQARSRDGGLSALRATNEIERWLLRLADQEGTITQEQPEWLRNVIVEISGTYAPEYRALAERWGMGESTLRRRFREEIGISLHTFAIQQRIGSARKRLVESNESLAKIADELGYGSEFFFARQFKQWTGVTPGVYRRSR